jgi:GTP cyclohydrolase I
MRVSDKIRGRLSLANATYKANDNIADFLEEGDFEGLLIETEAIVESLLEALVIDHRRDHNTAETAKRVAKMMLREIFAGRYTQQPEVTDFPNAKQVDALYCVGPITVRSTCAHHFQPIRGKVWIGVVPGDRVIGLSKFARLADWVMSRPQIQEEATAMLHQVLTNAVKPKGLIVAMHAEHLCMTQRGVKEHSSGMATNQVCDHIAQRPELVAQFERYVYGGDR